MHAHTIIGPRSRGIARCVHPFDNIILVARQEKGGGHTRGEHSEIAFAKIMLPRSSSAAALSLAT